MVPKEREMEMRKQALEEERRRREDLEKRLQEETSRRQKLIDREVKMREKQRAQVKKKGINMILNPLVFHQTHSNKKKLLFAHVELVLHVHQFSAHVTVSYFICKPY